ncbi:MAG: DUF397 domain-containing protein, partial [Actinomycetota bacterium]
DEDGWTRSTRSANGNCCLDAKALRPDRAGAAILIAVRNSTYVRDEANDPAAEPIIVLDAEQWEAFLLPIRTTGIASAPPEATGLRLTPHADGGMTLTATDDETALHYTEGEWVAFVDGVRNGELTTAALAALP